MRTMAEAAISYIFDTGYYFPQAEVSATDYPKKIALQRVNPLSE